MPLVIIELKLNDGGLYKRLLETMHRQGLTRLIVEASRAEVCKFLESASISKMKSKVHNFLDSLQEKSAPYNVNPFLAAIWHGLRGEWGAAHDVVNQDENNINSAWVHAWLHRQEGDLGNAAYWYRRAGKPVEKTASFEDEGRAIAEEFLNR